MSAPRPTSSGMLGVVPFAGDWAAKPEYDPETPRGPGRFSFTTTAQVVTR